MKDCPFCHTVSQSEPKCEYCEAGEKHEEGATYPCAKLSSEESPVSQSVEEFGEKGADIEHDRWARWQKYMFSKGEVDSDGVFHLPKEFVDRWFRQIDTKYADLTGGS